MNSVVLTLLLLAQSPSEEAELKDLFVREAGYSAGNNIEVACKLSDVEGRAYKIHLIQHGEVKYHFGGFKEFVERLKYIRRDSPYEMGQVALRNEILIDETGLLKASELRSFELESEYIETSDSADKFKFEVVRPFGASNGQAFPAYIQVESQRNRVNTVPEGAKVTDPSIVPYRVGNLAGFCSFDSKPKTLTFEYLDNLGKQSS